MDSFKSGYNPAIHHRRSIRLKGYDYSRPGVYFITICLQERCNWILGKVEGGQIRLSRFGEIVWRCWNQLPRHYSNIKLDEFVVMPNHVHGVIWLVEPKETGNGLQNGEMGIDGNIVGAGLHSGDFMDVKPAPTVPVMSSDAPFGSPGVSMAGHGPNGNKTYPGKCAKYPLPEIVRGFKTFSARRINELRGTPGIPVWQRNYYEHIVRNDKDLQRIREYIATNALRWSGDRFRSER